MGNFAAAVLSIDNFLTWKLPGLDANFGEISGKFIELVLRPLFKGMVMTHITLEANT